MMRTLLALAGAGIGYLLVIPVIIAGLPFWLVALLTRMLKPWIAPRVVQWTELIQFDPMVGWKPKPYARAVCEALQADVFYVETDEEGHTITCGFEDIGEVSKALEGTLGEAETVKAVWKPQNTVPVDEEKAQSLMKLIDNLEDDDDVQNVYSNFEVSDEVLAKLSA